VTGGHDISEGDTTMTRRRAAGLAATLAATVLLAVAGCGGDQADDHGDDPGAADQGQSEQTGADSGEPAAAGADSSISDLLDEIRSATVDFRDVAAAEAAGYQQVGDCVPMMGYHYASGIDETGDLDPLEPNILVYAPDADGGRTLVAVEYGSFAEGAELFGVPFDPPGDPEPPFSTLHAWVWLGNPNGTFSPMNPLVSCD
jgi:hypothetical protein